MNRIIILVLTILFTVNGCGNKSAKQSQIEYNDTINKDEELIVNEKTDINSNIIFSTEDLDNATWCSPDEYPLKAMNYEGKIYDNVDYLIKLPDFKKFKVVIWSTAGGDSDPYALCLVKSGIMYLDTSLDISPYWSEPGNDKNNYCNKTFKIYKDYTIEINTVEKAEGGKVKKYTKYYKINDEGDFYEVKEMK